MYVLKADVAKTDSFADNFTFTDTFAANNNSEVETLVQKSIAIAEPLKDIGSLGMKPHSMFMQLLDNIHVSLHVPYWEAIAIAAVMIRITLVPFALNSIRTGQRMVKMQPELAQINAKYIGPQGGPVPKEKAQEYAKEYQALTVKYDVHPLRAFLLPLFQIPISLCAFMGIREMDQYYPDYIHGGAFWFDNLAIADPTYILPILNSVTFLMIVEMGRFNQAAASTEAQRQQQNMIRNVMRVLGVMMVPFTASMPSVCVRQ